MQAGQDALASTYKALLKFFIVANYASEHFQLHCLLWHYDFCISRALKECLGNKGALRSI